MNIMKISLLTILSIHFVFSQGKEMNCSKEVEAFEAFVKSKKIEEAYTSLCHIRENCNQIKESVFIEGEYILQDKLKNIRTEEEKQKWLKDLIALYDEYNQKIPLNKNKNAVKKGMLLYENDLGSKKEIYLLLDYALENENSSFKDFKVINTYFSVLTEEYEQETKLITMEMFLKKYDDLIVLLYDEIGNDKNELNKKKASHTLTKEEERRLEIERKGINNVLINFKGYLKNTFTCSDLSSYYKMAFEKNKENASWLERTLFILDQQNCQDLDLFSRIVIALHEIKPSAQTNNFMGLLAERKNDRKQAIDFYIISAMLEENSLEKAKTYYKIARIFGNKDKSLARDYATKALETLPSFGRSYIYIAQLYANSADECGNTEFEKKAIYWLAKQTVLKAGEVEPLLVETSSSLAEEYESKTPTKKEINKAKMKKKEIYFDCWIQEKIIVPRL